MGRFGFRVSGLVKTISSVLNADVFGELAVTQWQAHCNRQALDPTDDVTYRFSLGDSEEHDIEGQLTSAQTFCQTKFDQLAGVLVNSGLSGIWLEFSWSVPGDGFVRSLCIPTALAKVTSDLGIEISMTAHAVEGQAFEG